MDKDRVVFFPILGERASRVQGITCKWTGGRAARSRGPLAGCSLLTAPVLAVQVVYSVRAQFPFRLPQV